MLLIQVYAPTSQRSQEELKKFYEFLDPAKHQCKLQEIVLVMADFSTKVRKTKEVDITWKCRLGLSKKCGERFIE